LYRRGGIPMKTRKPTKADLAYMLLGKAIFWTSLWGLAVAGFMWACTRTVIY